MTNRHGLSRHIPEAVRRQIRERSKYGCVSCRCGIYQYEHIVPSFAAAERHDPDAICCLCGSCHDKVTRGQWSKAKIQADYSRVQQAGDVLPPGDFFDFHDGNAKLHIGGILYEPAVRTLLRVDGVDVLGMQPSRRGSGLPGAISARFTDDSGREIFRIEENQWSGSLDAWDIETRGARIVVRSAPGRIALQLRHEPPGLIVVERADMRWGDVWVLATDKSYAVGRRTRAGSFVWTAILAILVGGAWNGVAIDVQAPWMGQTLCGTPEGGLALPYMGVIIGRSCGAVGLGRVTVRPRSLEEARSLVLLKKLSPFEWPG